MPDDYTPQDVLTLIEKLRDQSDAIAGIANDMTTAVGGEDAATEAGRRLCGPEQWAKIEAAHTEAERSGKPFDRGLLAEAFAGWERKHIDAMVAIGQGYRVLASAAAHFGHDPSPFTVSDRIAELTAAGHLTADRNDGSNGYLSALRIWKEFLRDAPFPEDAVLKLEADMKRRIAAPSPNDPSAPPHRNDALRISATAQEALQQYDQACEGLCKAKPTDREAYDWLDAALKRDGEKMIYTFATWQRYLRDGRSATGQQKNRSRKGRTGRSVVRQGEL